MYVYIYDSFLNQKKYDRVLANLETRITDLSLNGKIVRLDLTKNIRDVVENEIKRGAKAIIAVGNNRTLANIVNTMADLIYLRPATQAIPLAIIPIGEKNNEIAASLGIKPEIEACEALLARRIEKLDLGKANEFYFLNKAVISNRHTLIQINNEYSLEAMEEGIVNIVNLSAYPDDLPPEAKSSPTDGLIELSICTQAAKKFLNIKNSSPISQSLFGLSGFTVFNQKEPLVLDGIFEVRCPAEISVVPKLLNVIVGKERKF